jgi:arylsulfatase A-like enzyme
MPYRWFTLALLTASLVSGAPLSHAGELGAHSKPNIVVILADDMGYGDVQCFNPDGKIPTPNIDRLASQGVRFTDSHTGSAICSPTRYGLLTGRYAWRTHLRKGVLVPYDPPLIAADRLTVPGFLKQQGCDTACIGKWHLGWDWPKENEEVVFTKPLANGPTTRGFDHYFGTDVPNYPPYCFIENNLTVGQPTARKETGDLSGRPGPMLPGWEFEAILPTLCEKAESYLSDRAKDHKPFFLYVPLTSPHEPIAPSAQFKGKSGINDLADFMMETDWAVGEVLNALDSQGLSENTLVLFTCDNGHAKYTGMEDLVKAGHSVSGALRGFKADIWEGGHRVPTIARWPGVAKPGSVCDELICHTHLLATCADIFNKPLPDNAGEDSESILPLLRGIQPEKPIFEAVVHQGGNGTLAIREGRWKLVVGPTEADDELYDLAGDLGEKQSLLAERPDEAKRLTDLLQRYIAEGRSTPGAKQPNDVEVPLRLPPPEKTP